MTANTPTFGWPYPQGTDRVADGDNAIQALALAIENTIKAGTTTTITFGANVVSNTFLGGAQVWRLGNLAVLRMGFDITASVAYAAVIATVPVGWRPGTFYLGTLTRVINPSVAIPCRIGADGTVQTLSPFSGAATDYMLSIVYVIA